MPYLPQLCTCVCALLLFFACSADENARYDIPDEPYAVASTEGDLLNVIVEIPAGTNHKIEYRADRGFGNDTILGGAARVINFLPYPGNYGFVPSTLMDRERGGDGDPLDVLVIGESVPTGARLLVRPIGALVLLDRGEVDTKIIAVPATESERVFKVNNYLEFALEQDAARHIVETWFLNYKGRGVTELLRWDDENYAWREVRKWRQD